jgi:cell division protein FtsI (penicillin-binding protein 3)
MAVAPTFDSNRFGETPPSVSRNRAVTDVYEPGSTFKLMTVAGVLSDGLVTPSTSFVLPYSIHVADKIVHDADLRTTETMSVARILAQSSNVGAVTLAEKLGRDRLYRWIRRFGFGQETHVGFPGESRGFVLTPNHWYGSAVGNVPIGQGIAVTPIQMAAAYSVVANHGVWVRPHLVDHVLGARRLRIHARRVLTRTVAAELNAMLQNVVTEGTGTNAAVSGYKVAGKTGTAQKPDAYGGYSTNAYVASFVGMVPASHPKLVILVTVDEPQGAIWGGVVAAPAFAKIAAYDLQYLEVPPDADSAGR